jgi:hypothetical protein
MTIQPMHGSRVLEVAQLTFVPSILGTFAIAQLATADSGLADRFVPGSLPAIGEVSERYLASKVGLVDVTGGNFQHLLRGQARVRDRLRSQRNSVLQTFKKTRNEHSLNRQSLHRHDVPRMGSRPSISSPMPKRQFLSISSRHRNDQT